MVTDQVLRPHGLRYWQQVDHIDAQGGQSGHHLAKLAKGVIGEIVKIHFIEGSHSGPLVFWLTFATERLRDYVEQQSKTDKHG